MNRPLLYRINLPEDLKQLSLAQLEQLATEVRGELERFVPQTGGHFASGLGVCELAIALHRVFDTPNDKLVWDTGHQAYAHKMLTGRLPLFPTLRRFGGLSGFLRQKESPFDAFGAGHAGTSISAALGLRLALPKERFVVAVIGDGAVGSGMAFEALNHAGALKPQRFIVVFNENKMSISPNVGALSQASDKDLAAYFSAFGFQYIGPVDGHCFSTLLDALAQAQVVSGPVLLHLQTKKGKGHARAENAPQQLHALPAPGTSTARTFTAAFSDALLDLAEHDSRIVAITAGMAGGTGLEPFARAFPDRFFDVGIAEEHAVTLAAGLASGGARPVCAIYSTFIQRAFDQVVHDVCLQNLPVVFALDRAGVVGADGETHQGVFDLAAFRSIPNLALLAPRDENELRHGLFSALRSSGPVVLRYPRREVIGVSIDPAYHYLPFGRAEQLQRGSDGLILALGPLVYRALAVRETLLQETGTELAVVDARFAKPLDTDLLASLLPRFSRIYTIEDGALLGGFGSAIAEFIQDSGITLRHPLRRFGIRDSFVPHGTQDEQHALHGCDEASILARLRRDFRIHRVAAAA